MKSTTAQNLFDLLALAACGLAFGCASARGSTVDGAAIFSYAGRAAIGEGSRALGQIDSFDTRASVVTTTPFDEQTSWLAGFETQWLGFHAPADSLVPEQLSSAALKLGVNHAFNSSWSLRAEANPGIFGDGAFLRGGFGAPVALRLVYAASRDLQWAFGVSYDWRSGHPFIGAVGVRWHFAPAWTLSLLLPAPRVEWALTRDLTLYAGGSLRTGAFRVADDFGRARGRPAFDGQTVDYRETHLGVGARWQLTARTALQLGVGAMTDRRFEFHDRNLLLNGDGAPSAQLALTGIF